jgi:hypothetical protein
MYDDRTLWKHLDGALPAAESATIETAAAADPVLLRRLEELRGLSAAMRAGVPRPPAGFADRVVARALAAPAAAALDLEEARRFLRRVLVAAAVLAALGLAYLAVDVIPKILDTPLHADNPLGK